MTTDSQLSEHFWLSEFTASQAAARLGISNEPDSLDVLTNLTEVARLLEKVRTVLGGKTISISSGYRSPAVNKAVGGSMTSAHSNGCAADFSCPSFGTPRQITAAIMNSGLTFDQLIYEGTWVHIAIAEPGKTPRNQVMTAVFKSGQATTYLAGLV
ncbi:MAG: D-Ala-D-Ala carboxypeptidase family metallohydrolase [Gallionella sp.]|nr:D-Ala-D-Ala carboxypeptidase family metallohydrolase [Gallionella sp.]